jgi:hypothetical protein
VVGGEGVEGEAKLGVPHVRWDPGGENGGLAEEEGGGDLSGHRGELREAMKLVREGAEVPGARGDGKAGLGIPRGGQLLVEDCPSFTSVRR